MEKERQRKRRARDRERVTQNLPCVRWVRWCGALMAIHGAVHGFQSRLDNTIHQLCLLAVMVVAALNMASVSPEGEVIYSSENAGLAIVALLFVLLPIGFTLYMIAQKVRTLSE